MYTPNHIMLSLVPPNGTQLVGTVDGSYMFIFDRSLKNQVYDWFTELASKADGTLPLEAMVSSSETSAAPVQGKVLKGDVTFEFAAEKLDETVHVAVPDTERPPPLTETQEVLETVLSEDANRGK